MFLTPRQFSAGLTGKARGGGGGGGSGDSGGDEVPPYYIRKKRNVAQACLRCRRQKRGCTGKKPCVHCLKANILCEWIDPPEDDPTERPTQGNNNPSTSVIDSSQILPGYWLSPQSLPSEPRVQPGRFYDNPTEPSPFVPVQGTPTAMPQNFGVFPGGGDFDFRPRAGGPGNDVAVPDAVCPDGPLSQTVIVEGIPFYHNSPLAWSTSPAHHDQHGQPTVDYDPLSRPVDLDAHLRDGRGRVDMSETTRAAVQEAWTNTVSNAASFTVTPDASHSVYTSTCDPSAPPTYAAQLHDNVDGSLPMQDASSGHFPAPLDDALPGEPTTFTDGVSYNAYGGLPSPEPTYSTLFADRALIGLLPDGCTTVADSVSYGAYAALPSLEPTSSTQFADRALVGFLPDGSTTVADGVSVSSTQFADRALVDALPEVGVPFTDTVLYGTPGALPPLVQPSSSLSSALGPDGANFYGVPAFGHAVSYDMHGAFPALVPSSSSQLSDHSLETDHPSTAIESTDDLLGADGVRSSLVPTSSSQLVAHDVLDMLDLQKTAFMFTATDLMDVDGINSFVPTSSQLPDPGHEAFLPEGASMFTDAEFQDWLFAGTYIPDFDIDNCI